MNRIAATLLAAALVVICAAPAYATKFRFPIVDTVGIQFDYVIYADHDPTSQSENIYCTPWCAGTYLPNGVECAASFPYCYDAHDGTDFMLKDGFALMDAGSKEIVAAADGDVIEVDDSQYDRCYADIITQDIVCDGGPAIPGNRVKLRHADGMETWYWHIMKNSAVVTVGQKVKCGDVLAKVGSSGYSSAPHLHFEVRIPTGVDGETTWIDPFAGPHSQPESYWVVQWDPKTWLPGLYCDGDDIPDQPDADGDNATSEEVVTSDDFAEPTPDVIGDAPGEVVPVDTVGDAANDQIASADGVAPDSVDVAAQDTRMDTMPASDTVAADVITAADAAADNGGREPSGNGGCSATPGAGSPYGLMVLLCGVIVAFAFRRRGIPR